MLIKKIINHQGVIKYAKNTSWLLIEQMLRMVSGVIVGIWVARYLGPEIFGVYSYVITFLSVISVTAKLGLDSIVIREIVANKKRQDVIMGTAFWMKNFGFFLSVPVLMILFFFSNSNFDLRSYVLIVWLGTAFQSFEVVEFYYKAIVKIRYITICKIIQLLISSLIKIALIINDANIFYFVMAVFFDCLFLGVLYIFVCKQNFSLSFIREFDVGYAKVLIKDAWPILISSIIVVLYFRIDQILISIMSDDYSMGIYSAMLRISDVFFMFPAIISASVFPAICNAKKTSQEIYYKRLGYLYKFMFWMGVGLSVIIAMISDWLVVLLYGDSYRYAGSVLAVYIWSSTFAFLGMANEKWMISGNLQKYLIFSAIAGVLVKFLLGYVFMQEYGIIGLAWANLFAYAVSAYLILIFWKKTRVGFCFMTKSFFCS